MSDESYNLYDDDDNVISDDSSEAEEIDDLMNIAVSSLNAPKPEPTKPKVLKSKSLKRRLEKQRRRLKKKYIKWANKKSQRERIVNYFLPNYARRNYKNENTKESVAVNTPIGKDKDCAEYCAKEMIASKIAANIPTETIDLDDSDMDDEDHDGNIHDRDQDDIDDDDDDDNDVNDDMDVDEEENYNDNERGREKEREIEGEGGKEPEKIDELEKVKEEEMKSEIKINIASVVNANLPKENSIKPTENKIQEQFDSLNETSKAKAQNIDKSSSEPSISPASKSNATNNSNGTKQDSNENIFFNDELNRMYPKFDQIISEHVHSQQTLQSIKNKIELITLDVGTLNRQLEVKEHEYNKLLYEKRIKEEVLIRMLRKLKVLSLKKAPIKGKKYDLMALKEIANAITKYTPDPSVKEKQFKELTASELLQNRAKMTRKDLDIERASWGPVETILQNLYPEETVNIREPTKSLPNTLEKKQHHSIRSQYSDSSNQFKMNRPLSASMQFSNDFDRDGFEEQSQVMNGRLANPMLFPQDDFNETSDLELEVGPYSSTIEKLLTKSRLQHQSNLNHRNDTHLHAAEGGFQEDISVVPVFKETEYIPQTASKREQLVVRLESPSIKVCQHCGIHEARFLCAACQNQWYCSRSCQVTAWKTHCESCE